MPYFYPELQDVTFLFATYKIFRSAKTAAKNLKTKRPTTGFEDIQDCLENPASEETNSWSWSGSYRKLSYYEEQSNLGSAHTKPINLRYISKANILNECSSG